MASNNTGSNGNVNGSGDIRLEEGPVVQNAWTRYIERRMAHVDEVMNFPIDSESVPTDSDSSPRNGNTTPETDTTNRGMAPNPNTQLTEEALLAMNATQSSSTGLVARPEGRERSPTIDSVIAQNGSPRRQAAGNDGTVAAGTSGRRSLRELALDFGDDTRNILHGNNAEGSQARRL